MRSETKKRIHNSILKTLVVYDSEVGYLTQKLKNDLLAVEIDFGGE